jgi:hypothetical protein
LSLATTRFTRAWRRASARARHDARELAASAVGATRAGVAHGGDVVADTWACTGHRSFAAAAHTRVRRTRCVLGFGWILFAHRDVIASFGARWPGTFGAGVAAMVGHPDCRRRIARLRRFHDVAPDGHRLRGNVDGACSASSASSCDTSTRTGRLVRYFSNASYWMCLTHVALCAWLPVVFARLAAPALVKFSLVLSLATLLTGGSYHLFV